MPSNLFILTIKGGTKANIGHPAVYIQLNRRNPGESAPCPYCGLRYAHESHH